MWVKGSLQKKGAEATRGAKHSALGLPDKVTRTYLERLPISRLKIHTI